MQTTELSSAFITPGRTKPGSNGSTTIRKMNHAGLDEAIMSLSFKIPQFQMTLPLSYLGELIEGAFVLTGSRMALLSSTITRFEPLHQKSKCRSATFERIKEQRVRFRSRAARLETKTLVFFCHDRAPWRSRGTRN